MFSFATLPCPTREFNISDEFLHSLKLQFEGFLHSLTLQWHQVPRGNDLLDLLIETLPHFYKGKGRVDLLVTVCFCRSSFVFEVEVTMIFYRY